MHGEFKQHLNLVTTDEDVVFPCLFFMKYYLYDVFHMKQNTCPEGQILALEHTTFIEKLSAGIRQQARGLD